jgi:hypothetical protein
MYKEYKFENPRKAIEKKKQIRQIYGINIPIYEIEMPSGKKWFTIVHPVGLQPKKRKFDF